MNTFIFISIAHLIEHIAQILEVYLLHLPREKSLGFLGLAYPWLMRSETLHYALALYMLIAIIIYKNKFKGQALQYWNVALVLQNWHHLEHLLLLLQATTGYYLFNSSVPTSVGQLIVPKIELHFFYNSIIFIFMAIALWIEQNFTRKYSSH
ncbi:MAG: hypothetical protein ACRC2R_16915 [Xenococcaceae cyanobacterium]